MKIEAVFLMKWICDLSIKTEKIIKVTYVDGYWLSLEYTIIRF